MYSGEIDASGCILNNALRAITLRLHGVTWRYLLQKYDKQLIMKILAYEKQ